MSLRPGYADDLRLAHVIADQVDSVTMARYKAQDLRVETKPDLTPVTDADRTAEEIVRGVPVWATLIALIDGDEVVLGVVSAPALGKRWWAAQGSRAARRAGQAAGARNARPTGSRCGRNL